MYKEAVSASQLVKSPDSHAREPRSRLGGSSWLCYEKFISEFNEIPPCVKRDDSKAAVRGRIQIRTVNSERSSGQTNHEAKSRWCRQFPMIKQLH